MELGGYYDKYYDDRVDYESSVVSRLSGPSGIWGSRTYTSHFGNTRSTPESNFWSRSLVDTKDTETLLRRTFQTVRDFIIVLDFPFIVDIQFVNTSGYSTIPGARRIHVPTNAFDDTTKDIDSRVEITCGLGIHEAAHLLYTEYSIYSDYISDLESRMDDKMLCGGIEKIYQILINVLEDEVVEDRLLTERPGYQNFIKSGKEYMASRVNFKDLLISESGSGREFCDFITNLVRLIRFPSELDIDVLKKHSTLYDDVRRVITPLPVNTKETCVAVGRIMKKIREYDFADTFIKSDDFEKTAQNIYDALNNQVHYEVIYGWDTDSGRNAIDGRSSGSFRASDMSYKLALGKAERGTQDKVYFEKMTGSKDVYLNISRSVSKYVPAIRKLVRGVDKNYDFSIYGCRQGILDTNKLAEAYQGVSQVYIRTGQVRTNKTTLCVLIDESGSMYGSKERLARAAGVLLNDAFGDQPGVDLYIYGHSADIGDTGNVNLNIYREGSVFKPKYSMSSISARCQNRDGQAIWNVAKRVRKFTQSKCIMFVISDGEPAAYGYYGQHAIEDVRKYVTKTEKLGFEVIQVSIDHVYRVSEMFDKYINLESDISNLPKRLGEIIKKAIIEDKKTIVD